MTGKKVLLNAGCGYISFIQNDYANYTFNGWEEVKLDINKDTGCDIVDDIRNMKKVKDNFYDGVYSQHTLEHLFTHEVIKALKEFYRVLKKGGLVGLYLPDIEAVARDIIENPDIERIAYVSTGGPIRTLDVIFGYEAAIMATDNLLMLHKTAFTETTIVKKLEKAGFVKINVMHDVWDMWITAWKI